MDVGVFLGFLNKSLIPKLRNEKIIVRIVLVEKDIGKLISNSLNKECNL